jgi:hypothetical protein
MPKPKEYQTPLKEILDIIESTNDIVSKMLEDLNQIKRMLRTSNTIPDTKDDAE